MIEAKDDRQGKESLCHGREKRGMGTSLQVLILKIQIEFNLMVALQEKDQSDVCVWSAFIKTLWYLFYGGIYIWALDWLLTAPKQMHTETNGAQFHLYDHNKEIQSPYLLCCHTFHIIMSMMANGSVSIVLPQQGL